MYRSSGRPLVPAESVARWPLPSSGQVEREMAFTGGHVGFVDGPLWRPRAWAEQRAMQFLSSVLAGDVC